MLLLSVAAGHLLVSHESQLLSCIISKDYTLMSLTSFKTQTFRMLKKVTVTLSRDLRS